MSEILKPIETIGRKTTKREIVGLAKAHAREITTNGYDLLKVYIELKRYEAYLDTIIQEVKESTIEKAREKGEKDFRYADARVILAKRTKYNYERDDKWRQLNEGLERLKEEKKARENLLRQVEGEAGEIVNPETGEVEQVAAPLRESVPQIIIRL
ncbi:MAG: hypothetical protein J5I94_08255 [Phaeodactylibacter sp.]|nr:hypothetical protein [Phaeodactylibacter sp.]